MVAGFSHTVWPGAQLGTGTTGSKRTKNVLRSWSPVARAARQAANSPQFRISATLALTGSADDDRTEAEDPTASPGSASSRRLNPNHRALAGRIVSTGAPGTIASPTSVARMAT